MGIEVEKEVLEAIKYFHLAKIHYLEASILEAIWKIIRIIPIDKLDRIEEGIRAIKETYKQVVALPEAYVDAYKLYHEGHKDYIDNLIYATSQRLNLFLLTIDKELINFLKEKHYPVHNVVTPNEIKRILKVK
jgi:rRNA-processing protein FCF1